MYKDTSEWVYVYVCLRVWRNMYVGEEFVI